MPVVGLHVLTRTISPYAGPTQLLGVFPSLAGAEDARRAYIEAIRAGSRPDPWAEQPYHAVDLDRDVRVDSGWELDLAPGDSRVFIVTRWADGMGQILRNVVAVKRLRAEAEADARSREAAFEKEMFPYECEVVEAELGSLLADNQARPS